MAWLTFMRTNARFLGFGVMMNVCLTVGQTYFVSLFNDDLQAALGLNHGQLAALYGAATIIGAAASCAAVTVQRRSRGNANHPARFGMSAAS